MQRLMLMSLLALLCLWIGTTDAQIGGVELQMRRHAQGVEAKAQLDVKELSLRLESLETYLNVQYNAQTKSHVAK